MKNENAQISVEVTKDSITVGTWREAKYGRFNDVNTIRTFVYESLKSGAEWTCEETTPHFRYRGIAFFVNGNSIEDNNDKRVDAIAIPMVDLRAVWNKPAANERRSFTMKRKNIYTNQSQELLTLFEEAGNGAKVMCVPIDYAKKDHLAMLCNGNGHILRKPFSVKNSPEGIEYLIEQVTRSCSHRQIDLKHVFFGGEDVGSYAENFVNTLRSGGWIVAGVNAHDAKEQRANMQASTDRLDLMGIASMLLNRRGNCSPAQSGIYRNLRTVVRHRKKLVAMSTEVKNRMHTVVDRLFPGFLDEKKSGILSFSESSLYLMEDRFSPRQIRRRKRQKLIEILKRYGTAKPESTAAKLQEYAARVLNT